MSSEDNTDPIDETLAEVLGILRAGVDESYGDRIERSSTVVEILHDEELPGSSVVTYPGVSQLIWRYQHHDAETVRRRFENELNRADDPDVTVQDIVDALAVVAERLSDAETECETSPSNSHSMSA